MKLRFVEKEYDINKMSIQEFIHLNALDNINHITHTSLISPKRRFSFKREHQNKFIQIYCDSIYNDKNDTLGLTEMPLGKLPLVVDIDLRVPVKYLQDRKKLYTVSHIQSVVKIIQTILYDICVNLTDESLMCIVLEKPGYECKSFYKNGFHLHFINCIVEKHIYQRIIYPRILEELKRQDVFNDIFNFDECNVGYTYEDIFDPACFRNPWLMYGSRKEIGAGTYEITNIIDSKSNVISDKNDIMNNIKENVITYWPEGKILTYVKPVEYYLPLIMSIHVMYKEPVELKQTVLYTNNVVVNTDSPNKIKEPEQIDIKQLKDNIEVLKELVPLLSKHRSDVYGEWVQIGWLIYNISRGTVEGYNIWLDFSRRSDKFDEEYCEKIWSNSAYRGLSIGSLCYYAQKDSPKEYIVWKRNRIIEKANMKTELFKYNTHYDMAKILYDIYKSKYVCASISHKLWYEFVSNRWKRIEEGSSLRSKITKDIEEILVTIENNIKEQIHTIENPEQVKEVNDIIRKIRANIKNSPYKNCVMRESAELFYDENFLKKLDANPYIIGFKNGVIDLKNDIKREGCPDDYVSLQMNIECKDFTETDPEIVGIHKFLEQIFPDYTVRNFILDNYCDVFVGGNPNKHVMVWSGEGDNGKSVTEALFEKMLGEYAIKLPTSLLVGKRTQSSMACPELVRAGNGVRWALLQEPDQHDVLNIGILKELSGNDSFYARGLYKEGSEIKPQFKLVLVCNEPPKIPYSDKATWNRIRVIPFESTFSDKAPEDYSTQLFYKIFKKDKKFEDKLPAMIEAFAWVLLDHRRKRIQQGIHHILFEPEKVMSATMQYKSRNDIYVQYIAECIMEKPDTYVTVNGLYEHFKVWFKESVPNATVPSKSDVTTSISKIWQAPVKNKWKNKTFKLNEEDESNSEPSSPNDNKDLKNPPPIELPVESNIVPENSTLFDGMEL